MVNSNPEISSSANLCLTFLALKPQEQAIVTRCIANYTPQTQGKVAQLHQLAYCCLEMLRSLFNQSDWQQAEAILQKKVHSLPSVLTVCLGQKRVKQLSTDGLQSLIQLNQCSYQVPKAVEKFVATSCNAKTLTQATEKAKAWGLEKATNWAVANLNPTPWLAEQAQRTLQAAVEKAALAVLSPLVAY